MKGALFHEVEVGLPAGDVWEVYGTLRLIELVAELLPDLVLKAEAVEGDGGVGTVLKIILRPGAPGPQSWKEKLVKIDDNERVKEALQIEGGYLTLGFESYLLRFEIIEKSDASSTIKSTVEYEVSDEHSENASSVTTALVATIAETISKYLMEKKK